jgi:hypothetical protein
MEERKLHPMESKTFSDLLSDLRSGLTRIQDQKRRVKACVSGDTTVTCDQVVQLCALTKMWDIELAVLMYPKLSDKNAFEEQVINSFKYKDEKAEIREKLGL